MEELRKVYNSKLNNIIQFNSDIALSTWHSQYSKRSAGRKKTPEKDFITLNRLAAESGLTTAHDQTQFRACHDIRKREKEDDLTIQGSQKFPVDRVFGISTR